MRRATLSLRRNAAAAGSSTPRRAQQGVGGVAAARQLVAGQLQLVRGQRFELRGEVGQRERFLDHLRCGRSRGIGRQRRDAEGGDAEARQAPTNAPLSQRG